MKKGPCFPCAAAAVLLLAGMGHLVRAALGWNLYLNDWHVPLPLSWGIAVVLVGMAAWGFSSAQHKD